MSKRRAFPDLAKFDCEDYSHSDLAHIGFYDRRNQHWLVVPVSRAEELRDINGHALDFLRIGGPGVDGIAFGYRAGESGVWAYYPSESRFELMATSALELITNGNLGN